MRRDYRDYLQDILTAIDDSAQFTRGMAFDAFAQDRETINANEKAFFRINFDAGDLPRQPPHEQFPS